MSSFKKGDRIVCINNDNNGASFYLTIGRIYIVSDGSTEDSVWIEDDVRRFSNYISKRFISVSEYRQNIINDILR